MAARTLLLKLQEQGWIELPARRMASPTRSGRAPAEGPALPEPGPIESDLNELLPLRLQEVSQPGASPARRQLEAALHRYHYLGYRSRVGHNLQYGIWDRRERPVAAMVFGAPAWQCAVRDRWIGWSAPQRAQHLEGIVNNTRFILFPKIPTYSYTSPVLGCKSNSGCFSAAGGTARPEWTFATAA
jgi:hypothetical protein